MKPIIIYPDKDRSAQSLLNREWLCVDEVGGYASGTVLGVNTRRDHGLLVPYSPELKSRAALVSQVTETVSHPLEADLSGFEFVNGKISSHAHLYLQEFRLEHLVPTWIFSLGQELLEKKIICPAGTKSTLIQYRMLTTRPLAINLTPYFTFFIHGNIPVVRRDFFVSFDEREKGIHLHYRDLEQPVDITVYRAQDYKFIRGDRRLSNIFYREEYARGNEPTDLLFNPGALSFTLTEEPVLVVLSLGGPPGEQELAESFNRNKIRLNKQLEVMGKGDDFQENVSLAAGQFLFKKADPDSKEQSNWSILAGFHWFLDWGRDSMISLEGLTLSTKRFEVAKNILENLSRYVYNGLLFNAFNSGESGPSYNAADATLWFFHALHRYVQYSQDKEAVEKFYPLLVSFLNAYLEGSALGIKADPADGLIFVCSEFEPLTWMDAQIFGAVFTPRNGKPVEIQALWYNALELLIKWSTELGKDCRKWKELSSLVKSSFNSKFWYKDGQYLFDVIEGAQGNDPALRPNQIFSISLDNPVLEEATWKQVVDVCQSQLLTGYGLRSLGPKDKEYRPHYKGNRFDRDSAYHQGAVWAWLIGHFIDAWLKVYHDKKKARDFLALFPAHLSEAGVGSISEVFDGSYPHIPRGCIAQAWSVAEVLRSILKLRESAGIS